AGVLVFPEVDEPEEIAINQSDLKIDVYRSSGPGGQHVNTTDSAVRITHLPTGIVVAMQNEKSQIQNREAAMRVLRSRLLAGQHVHPADAAARIPLLPPGIVGAMQNEKSQIPIREAAMRVLRSRLLAWQQEQLAAEAAETRASQVRTMDRSERIRTYNFPENRIADHRTGYKANNLDRVLEGDMDPVIDSLISMDESERLAALGEKTKA